MVLEQGTCLFHSCFLTPHCLREGRRAAVFLSGVGFDNLPYSAADAAHVLHGVRRRNNHRLRPSPGGTVSSGNPAKFHRANMHRSRRTCSHILPPVFLVRSSWRLNSRFLGCVNSGSQAGTRPLISCSLAGCFKPRRFEQTCRWCFRGVAASHYVFVPHHVTAA